MTKDEGFIKHKLILRNKYLFPAMFCRFLDTEKWQWNSSKPNAIVHLLLLRVLATIEHFHYDVTHAKVSGSCWTDCALDRSIVGMCQRGTSRKDYSQKHHDRWEKKNLAVCLLDCRKNSRKIVRIVVKKHFNGKFVTNSGHRVCRDLDW